MVCWQNTSLTGAASCVSSHESRRVLTSCTPLLTLHHTKGFIPLSCDTKQLGKHTIRIKTFSSNIIGVTLRSRSRSITYLCSACLNYSKTTPRLLLSDKFDFWVDSGWKTQKKKKIVRAVLNKTGSYRPIFLIFITKQRVANSYIISKFEQNQTNITVMSVPHRKIQNDHRWHHLIEISKIWETHTCPCPGLIVWISSKSAQLFRL